ncbi:MAG: hypothetical protein R3250_17140 [Melioribacteraceae bacterium]|nr:hypothetical protein [Melioribacteraceae bacterium]
MEEKIICPKCEKGSMEKIGDRLRCDECDWNIAYTHYLDLKKILDGKVFLEGDEL